MKLVQLIFPLFFIPACAQVGINTSSPTASLDVNGDVRIRTITETPHPEIAKDSVLVIGRDGTVQKIKATEIIDKALPSVVKGTFGSSSSISLSLLSGNATLPFDNEVFDTNNEFNTSTYTFTAKNEGIYSISVQIKTDGSIGVATNFGVAILRNGSIAVQNSFANVGILGINATPPVRDASTLLQLNAGDTIRFQILGSIALGTVNILGDASSSQFSIHQIR
ncbi:complement C1q domain-containing protein [Flavobacteriaceae bacterium TK19130]|nr:complement C1q domain-containing protein [Thermobacterium salinum]